MALQQWYEEPSGGSAALVCLVDVRVIMMGQGGGVLWRCSGVGRRLVGPTHPCAR